MPTEVPLIGIPILREEVWPGFKQVGLGASFLSLQHCAYLTFTERSSLTKRCLPNKECEKKENWGQLVVGLGLSLLQVEKGCSILPPYWRDV